MNSSIAPVWSGDLLTLGASDIFTAVREDSTQLLIKYCLSSTDDISGGKEGIIVRMFLECLLTPANMKQSQSKSFAVQTRGGCPTSPISLESNENIYNLLSDVLLSRFHNLLIKLLPNLILCSNYDDS